MPHLRTLVLLALVASFAGCAGNDPAALPDQAPAAQAPAPATWVHAKTSGDLTTTVVLAADAFLLGPGTIDVPDGASRAFFNGTVDGKVPDESKVRLIPADCGSSDCYIESDTSGGAFSIDVDDPSPGTWQIGFFAGTAAQSGTWALEMSALVASAGNATAAA